MAELPPSERSIVDVPAPFRVIDQISPEVGSTREQLHADIVEALEFDEKHEAFFLEIQDMELPKKPFRIGAPTDRDTAEEILGDDRLTLYIVADHVVGFVLERRTENNYTEVVPASFLTEELAEHLKERTVRADGAARAEREARDKLSAREALIHGGLPVATLEAVEAGSDIDWRPLSGAADGLFMAGGGGIATVRFWETSRYELDGLTPQQALEQGSATQERIVEIMQERTRQLQLAKLR